MGRLLAWVASAVGGVVLARLFLRRRPRPPQPPLAPADPDDRAAELRRKLDESRTLVAERDEFEGGELTVDRAEPAPAEPDERRRQVHERARAAVQEMRRTPDE